MVLLSLNAASSHILNVYAQEQQSNSSGAITSAANTSISALMFKGNSLFIRGDYSQAIQYYEVLGFRSK
jgi:hypothetical protein